MAGGFGDRRSFGWLTRGVVTRSGLGFGLSSLLVRYVIARFDVDQGIGPATLVTPPRPGRDAAGVTVASSSPQAGL